ncbi:MAG TPA: peptidylprolyl isomerase [bacterium]|nr:peptidylprolyl isomerase [bacterium]
MKNKMVFWFIALLAGFVAFQCAREEEEAVHKEFEVLSQAQIDSIRQVVQNAPKDPVMENEVGVIETNFGTIVVEFFTDVAPIHTENFKRLANHGYYDGTWFHRIISGFMIQAGDILSRDNTPANDGSGGPGYTIPAEFSRLPHYRGRLSMARSPSGPNTAGSQFFIVQNPDLSESRIRNAEQQVGYAFSDEVVRTYLERGGTPFLDNQYTVFGEVIVGMDVVDKIAAVETNQNDRPVNPVIMTDVYVTDRSNVDLLN